MSQRIENALKVARETKVFELGRGVIAKVPDTFKKYFPDRSAIVIADCNTWKVAGEEVFRTLLAAGIKTQCFLIPDEKFHAEWKYIELVDKVLDDSGAIAVSAGSGVINDLCKLCSSHHNQSYISVATAASVDGYTSFGASISYKGLKQTFECPAPVALFADIDILAAAPKEMTAAGYADLAAKIPCGAEWMIADLFGTEPIVPEAWHVLQDCLDELLSDPEGVASGSPEAVGKLFEGLTLSGFAMQAARSSRPASCTDHLFSHFLDMTGHRFKGELQSHGFQVAIGTLTMCAFFDEFLKFDLTKLDIDRCVEQWPSLEQEESRARGIFKDFVDPDLGVRSIDVKYADREGVREQLTKVKSQWPELREKYRAQVYPFEKMQKYFRTVGAPADPSDIGVTRRQLYDMLPFVQLMRHRINLLDLAKRAQIYDDLVEKVFGKGGAWDLNKETK
jgi:Glycerol dehydrogenase and related enzymes